MQQIDLSLAKKHAKPDIDPQPMISEDVVLPIIESIIATPSSSLKQIQFPKKWRMNRSNAMVEFRERYTQLFENRRLCCSGCNESIAQGTNWLEDNVLLPTINSLRQANICYDCLKPFCGDFN